MPILARILRERGLVTERQVEEAIQHQVLYGGRLGTSLYELGFITEERLREALSRAHGVQATAVDPREIDPAVVALLPKALVSKHKVFPYRLKGKTLFLLMVDPQDHQALAKVGFSLGYIVKPFVVPEFRMIQLLRDHYGVDERWRYDDTHRPPVITPVPADRAAALAHIEEATRATRWWRRRWPSVSPSSGASCSSSCASRGPSGGGGGGRVSTRSWPRPSGSRSTRPSVFQTVARDKTVFIGRFGPGEENRRFLEAIGKAPSTSAVVFPIVLKGRVVNLVYGDGGTWVNVKGELGELLALLQKVPRAYLRIIRRRVAETRKAAGGSPAADDKESE